MTPTLSLTLLQLLPLLTLGALLGICVYALGYHTGIDCAEEPVEIPRYVEVPVEAVPEELRYLADHLGWDHDGGSMARKIADRWTELEAQRDEARARAGRVFSLNDRLLDKREEQLNKADARLDKLEALRAEIKRLEAASAEWADASKIWSATYDRPIYTVVGGSCISGVRDLELTGATYENTDNGRIYCRVRHTGAGTATVTFYKSSNFSAPDTVAVAFVHGNAEAWTAASRNGSGLSVLGKGVPHLVQSFAQVLSPCGSLGGAEGRG